MSRIVNTNGATSINHEGVDYEADSDGVFEFPEDVTQHLLAFPGWVYEYEHLDQQAAVQAAADVDPENIAGRLARLEADNASLRRQLADNGAKTQPAKATARPRKTVG